MNIPLVSIIIPVLNAERYLAEAIDSVLSQTYERYEIIVVGGQSTDNTEKIAKSYKQVRYIHQTGKGIWDAFNEGIDGSGGEFVAFLSADDLWAPNKLSLQVDYLLRHPEIQYTITRVKFFLSPGYPIPPNFKPELLSGDYAIRLLESLVARKSLFDDEIGKFNSQLTLAADIHWFARLKDRNIPMGVISEVLIYKRIHDENLSLSNLRGHQEILLKILKESIKRQRCQDDKRIH